MRILFDKTKKKEVVIIEPGEYHTTDQDRIIQTVLGSCVSVCLRDEKTGLAGMNHFMLPEAANSESLIVSDAGRYGIQAMELLINELIIRGADRTRLKAKVFGGGHVLNLGGNRGTIPRSNVDFALSFLTMENIPILAKDLGGRKGRKILFFTSSGKVQVNILGQTDLSNVEKREYSYKSRIGKPGKTGGFTLFDRRKS